LAPKGRVVALIAMLLAAPMGEAGAETPVWRHGLSLVGEELKYPPGFPHFDYVNPQAPKGGMLKLSALGTFDNFNPIIAGLKGQIAGGAGYLFEQLMTSAGDEVSTEYGLLAEAVTYPPDFSSVTYRLRAEARFHDGRPVTPEDVVWSFDTVKKHSPLFSTYYRSVTKAEKTGEREITFTFDQKGNRELPQIVGQLTVYPKHWFETRDPAATTLEPPLGSGPYRVKAFEPGRFVVWERVKDHWSDRLNVNVGRHNFDEIHFEYYRDSTVALEAFKAGRYDFRVENSAKNWATAYDFGAVAEKRVVLETFPMNNVGIMQAFVPNLRRDKFKDPRVRLALNYAYDFEAMNRTIFYDQYERLDSFFDGTELKAEGLPEGRELEFLNAVRDKVPPEVFTAEFRNPVAGSPEAARANLREAARLLREAGWEIRRGKLVNARTGETFTIEFLIESSNQASERIINFYRANLDRLGIEMTVRAVDDVQYENRVRAFDFDMVSTVWAQSLSPGNEQREFWGSAAADQPGSRNLAGIKDPAVDALIEKIIYAEDRASLVEATKALDRVLLWNHYVIPQFYLFKVRTARWDRFGRPDIIAKYAAPDFPDAWWHEEARSVRVGARQ